MATFVYPDGNHGLPFVMPPYVKFFNTYCDTCDNLTPCFEYPDGVTVSELRRNNWQVEFYWKTHSQPYISMPSGEKKEFETSHILVTARCPECLKEHGRMAADHYEGSIRMFQVRGTDGYRLPLYSYLTQPNLPPHDFS